MTITIEEIPQELKHNIMFHFLEPGSLFYAETKIKDGMTYTGVFIKKPSGYSNAILVNTGVEVRFDSNELVFPLDINVKYRLKTIEGRRND